MASPSLCPDRAPLVHHLPSSPSVRGGIQLLDVAYNRTEQRDRERERKQHTNLLPSTHWLFSFLVSVKKERQISCARRPAARWWKGAKGLLIIITIRQSNNNGEDFVFSFNSHIFKREKEEKKKTHKTKQNKSLRTLEWLFGVWLASPPRSLSTFVCDYTQLEGSFSSFSSSTDDDRIKFVGFAQEISFQRDGGGWNENRQPKKGRRMGDIFPRRDKQTCSDPINQLFSLSFLLNSLAIGTCVCLCIAFVVTLPAVSQRDYNIGPLLNSSPILLKINSLDIK